jgi:predicted lipoprotein with Yx(FWY)xxD motif
MPGSPLYEFSGDANGKFGCTTRKAIGFDFDSSRLASCTGPMSPAAVDEDWPALTTTGAPVAGPGVDQKLLTTVHRPGIGDQVVYGGHPLYLFDPPSKPFNPAGEGYLESVAPMYPWHGIWYLVSAQDGRPAPGPTTVGRETLPSEKAALAYVEFPTGATWPVTVYSYSLDGPGASECTGPCAVTWPPLLTQGQLHTSSPCSPCAAAKDLGTIRRPDGTNQVT